MDTKEHTIVLEQHVIEAWGLWWVQWQKDTRVRLGKQCIPKINRVNRVNRFAELHLQPDSKCLGGDTTSTCGANLSS